MNAFLSLVLSLILAFGTAGMPAVPETAVTYTVDNIVLTVQDETIVLNPALVLTTAAGSEQVQAQFGVELSEETLMPVAGEITADGVKFQLDEGRAYELSAATIDEMGSIVMDEQSAAIFQEFGEFAALIPAVMDEAYNMEANWALSEKLLADWIERSGATPETMEVEINGVTVPATAVALNITADELIASLDMVRTESSEVMQAYAQQLLDIMNLAYGSNCASYAEMIALLAETEGEDFSISYPMELVYGQKDGIYYSEALTSTEVDGGMMNVNAVSIYENGVTEMSMNMTVGNEELTMNMGGTFAYDLVGNLSVNFEIAGTSSEEDPFDMNIFTTMNTAVGEDGLKTSSSGMDIFVHAEEVDAESGYSTATEANVSFSWDSAERFEEDGSITADCEFNLYVVNGEEVVPVTLAFTLNRAEAAFADAFEGMELVQLPADTEAEEYQLLSSELFGLVSDLMTLSMDESVMQLMALFEAQAAVVTTEAVALPADEYAGSDDPAYIDEEYYMDEYDLDAPYEELDYPEYSYSAYDGGEVDYAAAAEVYGYELPAINIPEGYSLDWMYASPEYCGVDLYSEEGHFISMTMSPLYGYSSTAMQINADGSLGEIEGATAQVQLNEDGSYLYIDFSYNDTAYTLYVDGVPAGDVQAVLAGIVG